MTQPISGTGPIGPGPSAAEAQPLVGMAAREDIVSTTAIPANSVSYLVLDLGVQPAGTYRVLAAFFIGTDNANTTYWLDLFFNGNPSPIGAAVEQLNPAGFQAPRTGIVYLPHVGGSFVLDGRFARLSGSGNITLFRMILEVRRVTGP